LATGHVVLSGLRDCEHAAACADAAYDAEMTEMTEMTEMIRMIGMIEIRPTNGGWTRHPVSPP
jgi:hypothetical protein